MTTDMLPELLKTTSLITKTRGAMYRDFCLQIDDLATYQKTTLMVMNY